MPPTPYLSVVVASRNDNHGGDLLFRMQHFVNGIIEQCNRFELPSELIIVEWNPPADRPQLANALRSQQKNAYCTTRIIQVPHEVHSGLKNSDKFPLFQMIGKNVGIRRARGKFILATNIDIILDDDVMLYLKSKLKPGYFYRVDRCDVKRDIPQAISLEEVLKFCQENVLRSHTRFGTFSFSRSGNPGKMKKGAIAQMKSYLSRSFSKNPIKFAINLTRNFYAKGFYLLLRSLVKINRKILYFNLIRSLFYHLSRGVFPIHLNGCGDFTLLSARDWEQLRGYPEWQVFSWHLDGIFLYQARQHGMKEIDLAMGVYHIDHEGGFIADRPEELFQRLDSKGVEYISNEKLDKIIEELEHAPSKKIFNDENWGLNDYRFDETTFSEENECLENS